MILRFEVLFKMFDKLFNTTLKVHISLFNISRPGSWWLHLGGRGEFALGFPYIIRSLMTGVVKSVAVKVGQMVPKLI